MKQDKEHIRKFIEEKFSDSIKVIKMFRREIENRIARRGLKLPDDSIKIQALVDDYLAVFRFSNIDEEIVRDAMNKSKEPE